MSLQIADLTLTTTAAEAVRDLLAKRELDDHALRVFISGGGCAGYQYGMALEKETRPSDFVLEQHGVKIVIDDVSLAYMRGAVVDYVDDVMGSGFKIENPNATSTCGCGHSFRTDGQAAPSGGGGYCGG